MKGHTPSIHIACIIWYNISLHITLQGRTSGQSIIHGPDKNKSIMQAIKNKQFLISCLLSLVRTTAVNTHTYLLPLQTHRLTPHGHLFFTRLEVMSRMQNGSRNVSWAGRKTAAATCPLERTRSHEKGTHVERSGWTLREKNLFVLIKSESDLCNGGKINSFSGG